MHYAVGDIQGCFQEFMALLELIHFNPVHDTLWLTGDLVNRGPQSLEVLRYIKNLGEKAICVLGNHDLHLLAVAYGAAPLRSKDTVGSILTAPDHIELIEWLRFQPLIYTDLGFTLVHAGIAPQWTIAKAHSLAKEVCEALQGEQCYAYLKEMYGNTPDFWQDDLEDMARLRCITNYLTRMRFCTPEGKLNLTCKLPPDNAPSGYLPWYTAPNRLDQQEKIIFGHWAALNGKTDTPHTYALDTGCVWGHRLTALALEMEALFSVKAK